MSQNQVQNSSLEVSQLDPELTIIFEAICNEVNELLFQGAKINEIVDIIREIDNQDIDKIKDPLFAKIKEIRERYKINGVQDLKKLHPWELIDLKRKQEFSDVLSAREPRLKLENPFADINLYDIDFDFILEYISQYPLFNYKKNTANTDKDIVYFKETDKGSYFECCHKFASLSEDKKIHHINRLLGFDIDANRSCIDEIGEFIPKFTQLFIDPLYEQIQKDIVTAQTDLKESYDINSLNISNELNKQLNQLIHDKFIPTKDFIKPSEQLEDKVEIESERSNFQDNLGKTGSLVKNFLNMALSLEKWRNLTKEIKDAISKIEEERKLLLSFDEIRRKWDTAIPAPVTQLTIAEQRTHENNQNAIKARHTSQKEKIKIDSKDLEYLVLEVLEQSRLFGPFTRIFKTNEYDDTSKKVEESGPRGDIGILIPYVQYEIKSSS